MKEYLITVIVPVYNCEKYLERSIKSLISQTFFENIEFIFVNDGSIDNSVAIIKKYIDKYENFKIIEQENKGVSSARNIGLLNSKGKYIAFFDADDVAEPMLYEKLYSLIVNNNVDISIVDYCMVFGDGTEKKHRASFVKRMDDKTEIMKSFFYEGLICTNPVDKMFKRNVVENILFPEGYAIGEDMFFVYKTLKVANSIVIDSTKALYRYCLHSESAMKKEFSDKHLDSVFLAEKIFKEFEIKDKLYRYAEANYMHEICKMFGLLYRSKAEDRFIQETLCYKEKLNSYSIFKAIRYMNIKHMIALELMKISPHIYERIYRILKVG